MKYNTNTPIYMQIIDSIIKDIVTGVIRKGEKMESVRALAEKYEVNLNTMQRACSELERKGVIYIQRGIGSFVADDEILVHLKDEMSVNLKKEFINGMRGLGYTDDEILESIRKELEL